MLCSALLCSALLCSALLCSAVSISLCIHPCQPLFSKKTTKLLMAEKATFFSGNWLTQWVPIALRRRLAPGLPMNLIADIIPYKSSMNKSKVRINSNKYITKNGLGIRNAGDGGLPRPQHWEIKTSSPAGIRLGNFRLSINLTGRLRTFGGFVGNGLDRSVQSSQ